MMIHSRFYLVPLQQHALLLSSRIRSSRDHALFSLALGAGLSGSAIHPLDVGHLSKDGQNITRSLEVRGHDRRVFAANDNNPIILRDNVRLALMRHIDRVKELCPHFRRPVQATVITEGHLCATCGHEVDIMKLPLFLSRFRDRLSVRRMRSLFAAYRDDLRLPPHLHFDSLKETFEAGRVVDLNAA